MKPHYFFLKATTILLVTLFLYSCNKDDGESINMSTITSISPEYGLRGSTITITGTDFHSSAVVYFNDVEANAIQSITATSIVVTVPDLATTGKVTVVQGGQESEGPAYHVYTPIQNLYFTDYGNNKIDKIDVVNTPGSIITLFDNTDGINGPACIALGANSLYITEYNGNRILKTSKSGTGSVVVLYDATDGVDIPGGIDVDESTNSIYWTSESTDQIFKGSDGGTTTPEAMYGGNAVITSALGLKIDTQNGLLYTSDFGNYIKYGNLDGTGSYNNLYTPTNSPGMMAPSNLFLDPVRGKIYWTDETAQCIVEANLDGTGIPVKLFDDTDGVVRPDGIVVDYASGLIYWTDSDLDGLYKGNLDGSGSPSLVVDGFESYGMVAEFQD